MPTEAEYNALLARIEELEARAVSRRKGAGRCLAVIPVKSAKAGPKAPPVNVPCLFQSGHAGQHYNGPLTYDPDTGTPKIVGGTGRFW